MSIKIALDLRYRIASGVSSCIRDLIPAMLNANRHYEFTIIKYPDQQFAFEKQVQHCIECPAENDIQDIIWTNTVLRRLLKDGDYTIYHGMKWAGPMFNPVASVFTAHSISYSYRGEDFPLNFKTALYVYLYHIWAVKRVDRVIAVSAFVRDFLNDCFRIPANRIRQIYNGVNPDCREFSTDEQRVNPANKRFGDNYLLCLGNLLERKNQKLAMQALQQLKGEYDYSLVCAGGDPEGYRQVLEQEAERLGIAERVHFAGFAAGEELLQIVNGAKALIHVSFTEGLALATVEAAKCGLPIVTTRCQGPLEVFSEAAIFIESPHDVAGLAGAIRKLLTDDEYYEQCKSNCQNIAAQFCWESTAYQYLSIYDDITGLDSSPVKKINAHKQQERRFDHKLDNQPLPRPAANINKKAS